MTQICTLYRLTFPNSKIYIGATKFSAEYRFEKHCKYAPTSKNPSGRAIMKFGRENILVETLAVGSEEYIFDLEIKAIRAFNSTDPRVGYNVTTGGRGIRGIIFTEEHRRKISVGKTGKTRESPSVETRRRQSAAMGSLVTAFGEARTVKEWSEITGIKYMTLLTRLRNRMWAPEKALTEPLEQKVKFICAFGENKTVEQWSKETGIKRSTILYRVRLLGWSPEKAVSCVRDGRSILRDAESRRSAENAPALTENENG